MINTIKNRRRRRMDELSWCRINLIVYTVYIITFIVLGVMESNNIGNCIETMSYQVHMCDLNLRIGTWTVMLVGLVVKVLFDAMYSFRLPGVEDEW